MGMLPTSLYILLKGTFGCLFYAFNKIQKTLSRASSSHAQYWYLLNSELQALATLMLRFLMPKERAQISSKHFKPYGYAELH